MPKPVHIVCSESGSEDRITGKVSLVNLIEKIQIQKIPEKQTVVILAQFSLWVSSLWHREKHDEDKEFEYESLLYLPPEDSVVDAGKGAFLFNKQSARITARFSGLIPFKGPGIMRAVVRIRAISGGDWISQEQPIEVEEVIPKESEEPKVIP
jgi:hypothetical protein